MDSAPPGKLLQTQWTLRKAARRNAWIATKKSILSRQAVSQRRKRQPSQEWRELPERQVESGSLVEAFCRREDINPSATATVYST